MFLAHRAFTFFFHITASSPAGSGFFKKNRYLVVLEGLSNMSEWEAVRKYLTDSKNGSRIVVSTQQLEVAQLCAGQSYHVSELRKLPDNHSICAFFNEVCRPGTSNCPSLFLSIFFPWYLPIILAVCHFLKRNLPIICRVLNVSRRVSCIVVLPYRNQPIKNYLGAVQMRKNSQSLFHQLAAVTDLA